MEGAKTENKLIINKKHIPDLTVSLFPNPARDQIQLRLSDALTGSVTASIYNLLSEVVYYQHFPIGRNAILDIRNLKSGTYLVEISSGQRSSICKLVKL
jgi:hypothetical protein